MKVAYRISEKANEDLEEIWIYTYKNWSSAQADRYYNLIMDEIEFIAANFESGQEIENVRLGYRKSKVKSHILFYRKAEDGIIEIIRILHQMMDIENRLK